MLRVASVRSLVGVLGIGLAVVSLSTAATRDYAVEVTVAAQESPPRLDFSWRADPTAAEYRVFRKAVDESVWTGPIAVLAGSATTFGDGDVAVGEAYEYSFQKTRGVVIDTVRAAGGTAVTFTIKDSWGDGVCCEQGLGSYKVTGCGTVYASGGAFGDSASSSFTVGSPGDPSAEVVVTITLDVFGSETTWKLTDDVTGQTLSQGGPYSSPRFGHVLAGVGSWAPEDPGAVLLLVAGPVAGPLAAQIGRLEIDLIRDGYRVTRRDVPDGTAVPAVKDIIVDACRADPTISTLFILGHVAVPYSGDIHGAHPDHWGAWPADVFYGDLDGVWTDSIVTNTGSTWPANHNVPGDGKFDQTYLPSNVELAVGRVDLAGMTIFPQSEVELVGRYLDKDHAYRTGQVSVPRRGLIQDRVGEVSGVAYACTGWRNFTAMFGPGSVHTGTWLPTLETEGYLAAYGCSPSSFTSCSGVVSTSDFATRTIHAVFTMLMGSYFGDWDKPNDLLRAPLGSVEYPLACCWAGRPAWNFHHMALGYPIGHSARVTQNNHLLYMIGYGGRQIHIALMGDPTLRLHVVKPPTGLALTEGQGGSIDLAWCPPADSVAGYNVYRAPALYGDFIRINAGPVADTAFVDSAPLAGRNAYMVRAVKLETTGSGTYYNLSAGVIDSVDAAAGVAPSAPSAPDAPGGAADSRLGAAPNPSRGATEITFDCATPGQVRLRIYDGAGRLVRTLDGGRRDPGRHTLTWDGRDARGRPVAGGVYFLEVSTGGGGQILSSKLVRVE